MTTANQAKDAIYKRLLANITLTTNVVFDNDEPDFESEEETEWVRLVVRGGPRTQDTLGKAGNRRFRTTATMFVQVYTLAGTGVKQGDLLAKEVADIFEGTSFSGVDFYEVPTRESGPDGKWFVHIVEGEFDYDEIR